MEEVPLTHGYTGNSRGVGMADMIRAMALGRDHRCNERLAFHVLDVMHAFYDAHDQRTVIDLASSCDRPTALPAGVPDGQLERLTVNLPSMKPLLDRCRRLPRGDPAKSAATRRRTRS